MRERPILFSASMIRALLDGTKTQTRRIVTLPAWAMECNEDHEFELDGTPEWPHAISKKTGCLSPIECPYGQPGDQLWVRETCRAHEITDAEADADFWKLGDRIGETPPYGLDGVVYLADNTFREIENTEEAGDKWMDLNAYRGMRGATVPAIRMPRWASRITLEIESVRVERLQDISEADVAAEGVPCYVCDGPMDGTSENDCHCFHMKATASDYRNLWESINGAGSWDANPFVWVVEFKRVKQ